MNILQEEKGSTVVYSDFAAIVCILFIAYSWHFWLAVAKIHNIYYLRILINSQRARVRVRQRSEYGACICK